MYSREKLRLKRLKKEYGEVEKGYGITTVAIFFILALFVTLYAFYGL